jgi:hypothetical protein
MSADGEPPGTLTFFFFLASRPCLSRPLPMGTSFYHEGLFAQEGFDIGEGRSTGSALADVNSEASTT